MSSDARSVTIRSVAAAAGVSIGTVSNALNAPEKVTAATRARVLAAIQSTGYIPSSAAQDLASRRARGVGLIVPDMNNALWVDIARGARASARRKDLNLLIGMTEFSLPSSWTDPAHPDDQDEYLDYFARARAEGLLLATMRDPRAGLHRIGAHVSSVVVINWDDPHPEWCTVLMDNEGVGTAAIDHLADLDFTRAYFLSPSDPLQPIVDRRRGLHSRGRERGVHVIDVLSTDLWVKEGRAAARSLVGSWRPGERFAIIGVTDALALGAIEELRNHPDIRVPADIAVIGLDGDHRAEHSDWITLTSFRFPGLAMGTRAAELLIDQLAEPPSSTHVHQRVVLPAVLQPRETTVGSVR